MKVGELINYLEDYDEDAEVFIMSQQSWPFENTVSGVVAREEIVHECENEEEGDEPKRDEAGELKPTDVFVLEGRQLRYGTKNAWNR